MKRDSLVGEMDKSERGLFTYGGDGNGEGAKIASLVTGVWSLRMG